MSVIGIDPGISGAMAHYENGRMIDVVDMPAFDMTYGKKTRKRLDMVDLIDYFQIKKMMGVELVLMEAVGGRPRQSASAAFVFGYTVGAIAGLLITIKLPLATVSPQVWKKMLQVPGKKDNKTKQLDKGYAGKIVTRADELLPNHRDMWRGPNGGLKVDRAEAALLALYAERYFLRVPGGVDPTGITEYKMVYKQADTGA